MKGFLLNIEKSTLENESFRKVLYTAHGCQLVLMCLKPNEEIGEEVHEVDQFFRFESGQGNVVIDGVTHKISDGFAVVIPRGAKHNVVNTSAMNTLKMYTIYTPPHHKDGIKHTTKHDAESDEEEFDGKVTEQ
jgi:mannose-6-phosphate isomerase-like protein (cupin superfamily)